MRRQSRGPWLTVLTLMAVAALLAPRDGHAQSVFPYAVQGAPSAALEAQFATLLLSCLEQSAAFADLAGVPFGTSVPVRLVANDKDRLFGAFSPVTEPQVIDLGDILRLPFKPGEGGIPAWGPTQCTMLAHELAEAREKVVHGDELKLLGSKAFDQAHERAIGWENRLRVALGQSQCRQKALKGNEAGDIPHRNHSDAAVRYGGHSLRIHFVGTDSLTFEYETGRDTPCPQADLDIM